MIFGEVLTEAVSKAEESPFPAPPEVLIKKKKFRRLLMQT